MTHRRRRCRRGFDRTGPWCLVWVALALGGADRAWAAVLGIRAAGTAAVQELIDDAPASLNQDSASVESLQDPLPMVATVSLLSTDLQGLVLALGRSSSEFHDPGRLNQANPEELALEAACFSNNQETGYVVSGGVEEIRNIVFTRSSTGDVPREITFRSDGTRELESSFFLSGAVVVWATSRSVQLDDIVVTLEVRVARGDLNGEALFETRLDVSGEASGNVGFSVQGPLRVQTIAPGALIAAGVDPSSTNVVETLGRDGTLFILAIPPQEHVYRYTVRADEPFNLIAELRARVRNVPGGTGVAAVLGRPFEELADFLELGLPGADGTQMQRVINEAVADRAIGRVAPDGSSGTSTLPRLCGLLGAQGLALGMIALILPFVRRGIARPSIKQR